jgi:hypothetical protein
MPLTDAPNRVGSRNVRRMISAQSTG